MDDMVLEVLKLGGGIGKAKEHDKEFTVAMVSGEGNFVNFEVIFDGSQLIYQLDENG